MYGTPEYNRVFVAMLEEVLGGYGPVFEVWFDGANGEGPNGKRQVYDWPLFIATVRRLQPQAVIFSDAGPDIRWVGNERGEAPLTVWSTIDRARYAARHAAQPRAWRRARRMAPIGWPRSVMSRFGPAGSTARPRTRA